MTQGGKLLWQREKSDREHYMCQHNNARFILRFHPARVGRDLIEFIVQSLGDEEVGKFVTEEDTPTAENTLANLLFAVQRAEGKGNLKHVAEDLINLLPDEEKPAWGPKK
jgi:hypothetical protein